MQTPQAGPQTKFINPSPKTRFQQSGNNVSEHRKLIDLPAFQRGVDMALLQYQATVAEQVRDGNSAASAGLRLLGVHEFLTTFRLLSEPAEIPKPLPTVGVLKEN